MIGIIYLKELHSGRCQSGTLSVLLNLEANYETLDTWSPESRHGR